MSNNYAVINGKKVELTEEHLKALGVETRKNPFERVAAEEHYYCVKSDGTVERFQDSRDSFDNGLYSKSNYFNDKEFAKQIALYQLLYRKLLKFAYDNGFEDTKKWELCNRHWRIYYDHIDNDFTIIEDTSAQNQCVYFSTGVGAKRAIEEVVKPFIKEHPEFVW